MTQPRESARGAQRRVARNAALLLARQLFVTAVGIAVTALVARHLGPVAFGQFEYAFALVIGFGTLAEFGLRAVTVRTVAQQIQPLDSYLGLMMSLRLALACVVWPLLMVVAYAIGSTTTLVGLVAIASVSLPLNALGTTLRDAAQGLERFKIEAFTSVSVRVVTLAGSLAVIALDFGVVAIVSVYASGAVVGLLVPLRAMRRAGYRFGFRWSASEALRELRLALPFGANAVVGLLMWEINPVLIKALSSFAMVGVFAAGTKLVTPLEMIPDSVSDALTPAVARAWISKNTDSLGTLIGRTFYGLLLFGLPIAVGGALCAQGLVNLVFGDAYGQAAAVMRILAVVLPLEFLTIPTMHALGAIHQQNRLLWISGGGAAVNLTMAVLLIPHLGAVGCAGAVAGTTVFCCVASLLTLRRHCRLWHDARAYAKLIGANILMGLAVYGVLPYGVLLAVPVGVVVYALLVLGLRAVSLTMLRELLRPSLADPAEDHP